MEMSGPNDTNQGNDDSSAHDEDHGQLHVTYRFSSKIVQRPKKDDEKDGQSDFPGIDIVSGDSI